MFYFKRVISFLILIFLMMLGFLIPYWILINGNQASSLYDKYLGDFVQKIEDATVKVDEIFTKIEDNIPEYYVVEEDGLKIKVNFLIEKPVRYNYLFDENYIDGYINSVGTDNIINNINMMDLGYTGFNVTLTNNTDNDLFINVKTKVFHGKNLFPIPPFSDIEIPSFFNSWDEFVEWENTSWSSLTKYLTGDEYIKVPKNSEITLSPDTSPYFYFGEDEEGNLQFFNSEDETNVLDFNLIDFVFWKFEIKDSILGPSKILSTTDSGANNIFSKTFYRYEGVFSTDGTGPFIDPQIIEINKDDSNISQFSSFPTRGIYFTVAFINWVQDSFISDVFGIVDSINENIDNVDDATITILKWVIIIISGILFTLILWLIIILYYYFTTSYHKSDSYVERRQRKKKKNN